MNRRLIMGILIVSFLIVGKVGRFREVPSPRKSLDSLMYQVQELEMTLLTSTDSNFENKNFSLTYDVIDITEEGDLAQIWMVVQQDGQKAKELRVMFKKGDDSWIPMVSAEEMMSKISVQSVSISENNAK